MKTKCIDCGPDSKRPTPHPGPRCYTHHREKLAADDRRRYDQHLQRTYGITIEDYEDLYQFQGGRCYICKWATGKTKRLACDHDHTTGEVRGLLCSRDNRMVGFARDDPEYFKRAAEYLENPPYKRMKERRNGDD